MGSLWNRSGTIERFADDLKAGGAKAFFFSGGTTTPLTVYEDAGEGASHPHPVVADAHGRWPDVFVPYILSYDVRVVTAEGVQLTYSRNIPNPNPVDVDTLPPPVGGIETGMIHAELTDGVKPGFVRLNGKTIGNDISTATERSNDDTLNLFVYLWNNLPDSIATVSGGRGFTAEADFDPGNKTIVLPDCRGSALMGLATMGAVDGGFYSGITFSAGSASVPGSFAGANVHQLTLNNMPAHTHGGTTNVESPTHTHTGLSDLIGSHNHATSSALSAGDHSHTVGITDPGHSHTGSVNAVTTGGSGSAVNSSPAIYQLSAGSVTINAAFTGITAAAVAGGAHTHGLFVAPDGNHQHVVTIQGGSHSHAFTTDSKGLGQAFETMPLMRLVTWYIKL